METNRILLRPWRECDAEALFKYASDPDVGPRAGWEPHKSVEESLQIIRTIFGGDHNPSAVSVTCSKAKATSTLAKTKLKLVTGLQSLTGTKVFVLKR